MLAGDVQDTLEGDLHTPSSCQPPAAYCHPPTIVKGKLAMKTGPMLQPKLGPQCRQHTGVSSAS